MSKAVKEMELSALRQTFGGVRDLVLLSISGLSSQATGTFRANLRKKKLRVQVVKNTLIRRILEEGGISLPANSAVYKGPLALVWGEAAGIAEIAREVDGELKNPKLEKIYKDKVGKKGAFADGQFVDFETATTMPTREEAIASILAAILGPAGAIAGCLTGPVSQVASQIEKISEKTEEGAETPAA